MESKTRCARHRETGDMAFAGYALLKGLHVVKAEEKQKGRVNDYRFTFDDPSSEEFPDGRWDKLYVDYANSESAAYDSAIRTLKKLCKRNGQR